MGFLMVRALATIAAVSLLFTILIPVEMVTGHTSERGAAVPLPCSSGSDCNVSTGCPETCPATNHPDLALREIGNRLKVGVPGLTPSAQAVGLKPHKPPPKPA